MVSEFVRVLTPGGRLCASVWVKPEQNPNVRAFEIDGTVRVPGLARCIVGTV